VDLHNQEYKVTVNKGKRSKEILRAITDDAKYLWQNHLNGADPEDYVFSKRLRPGPVAILRPGITRRWETHVQIQLGITAKFYHLKRLFLEKVAGLYDIETSQGMADHSTKVVTMMYAIGEKKRALDKKKKVHVNFAG